MSAEPTDELHFLGQSPVVWFLKVQFLKSGCSIHWFLKYEKVPRAKLRLYGFSWFFMVFHGFSCFSMLPIPRKKDFLDERSPFHSNRPE